MFPRNSHSSFELPCVEGQSALLGTTYQVIVFVLAIVIFRFELPCLDDQRAAAESGSLSSRILRHSTSSAWAASSAGDPAICPACSASLARRNRRRHSGGLAQNPLPWPQPHPSVSNPDGTNGMPFAHAGTYKPTSSTEVIIVVRGF